MGNPQTSFEYDPSSVLRIYCFGKFRVLRPGENEAIGIVSKHKMWQLFKYLLINRRAVVPTLNLVNDLWPAQKRPDDTSALRTTVCRLKSMLEPKNSAKSQYSYIIYRKDSCAFNLNAPYWLDIEVFEQLCAVAKRQGAYNRAAAINSYIEALDLYQGDFLAEDPNMESATSLREYYRLMFLDAVRELAGWLIEQKDFVRARYYLEKTVKIDPYMEDLQTMLIRVLLDLGEVQTAKAYYISCSALLYSELGVKPSETLKKLYNTIKEREKESNNSVKQLIDTEAVTQEEVNGPFVCDPELFWTCLLLERRRVSRNGAASMVVLELGSKHGPVVGRRQTIFNQIKVTAENNLRKSDILCKLDEGHFALLLPSTSPKGAKIVLSNIFREFYKNYAYNKKELDIQTKVNLISI
jgi:DNA-binding SARP family transcriptional activator